MFLYSPAVPFFLLWKIALGDGSILFYKMCTSLGRTVRNNLGGGREICLSDNRWMFRFSD